MRRARPLASIASALLRAPISPFPLAPCSGARAVRPKGSCDGVSPLPPLPFLPFPALAVKRLVASPCFGRNADRSDFAARLLFCAQLDDPALQPASGRCGDPTGTAASPASTPHAPCGAEAPSDMDSPRRRRCPDADNPPRPARPAAAPHKLASRALRARPHRHALARAPTPSETRS